MVLAMGCKAGNQGQVACGESIHGRNSGPVVFFYVVCVNVLSCCDRDCTVLAMYSETCKED